MKLFIPSIGTMLKLTDFWRFSIHIESRNDKVYQALDYNPQDHQIVSSGETESTQFNLHHRHAYLNLPNSFTIDEPIMVYKNELPDTEASRKLDAKLVLLRTRKQMIHVEKVDHNSPAIDQYYTRSASPAPYYAIMSRYFEEYKIDITLPPDTVLKVARIYIRQGQQEFNSVTFKVTECKYLKKNARFWVKLDDVNRLECDIVQ